MTAPKVDAPSLCSAHQTPALWCRSCFPDLDTPQAPAVEVPVARDAHRGGSSYEASMLRNLLAVIHRDGGHYVEAHGLDKALEDAETVYYELRLQVENLTQALKEDVEPQTFMGEPVQS
jgi:hypothetical protein